MSEFDRDDYMTTGEAAAYLGVSAETVRRWVKDGRVPAVTTTGGRHLIQRADVDAARPQPATAQES